MTDTAWLARLGHFAAIVRQCERRLDDADRDGAVRAFTDFESALERLCSMPDAARPRSHALLVEDLRDIRGALATRIRALRK